MNYLFRSLTPESVLYQWLIYWRWIPRTGILAFLCWVGIMAADRSPPFRLLDSWTNQPRPGGVLVVHAKVRRELERECSVTFSRYLFDRFGNRHESGGPQLMTPKGLREMDSAAPGELNLLVPVPLSFPPGPGKLTTMLEYRCNPLQDVVRPIGLEMNIPFEVLP